jgi:hypothetical protein
MTSLAYVRFSTDHFCTGVTNGANLQLFSFTAGAYADCQGEAAALPTACVTGDVTRVTVHADAKEALPGIDFTKLHFVRKVLDTFLSL